LAHDSTESLFEIVRRGRKTIMTILVVNNDPEFYAGPPEQELLESLEKNSREKAEVISFTDIPRYWNRMQDFNALVLSGSSQDSHSLAEEHKKGSSTLFQNEMDLIRTCRIPILGICFGHQLVAHTFGSRIARLDHRIEGFQDVEILERDEIFSDWEVGDVITVLEYHTDYVTELPRDFVCLARSKVCKVESMRHRSRPIYTVQFHPETWREQDTGVTFPEGGKILRSFFEKVCR